MTLDRGAGYPPIPGRQPAANFCCAGPPSAQTWHVSRGNVAGRCDGAASRWAQSRARARAEVAACTTTGPIARANCSKCVHPLVPPKTLLHRLGVPATHAQPHERPEGPRDRRALGMREPVHLAGRRLDSQIVLAHRDPKFHVMDVLDASGLRRPWPFVTQAGRDPHPGPVVVGVELDGATVEEHAATVGPGISSIGIVGHGEIFAVGHPRLNLVGSFVGPRRRTERRPGSEPCPTARHGPQRCRHPDDAPGVSALSLLNPHRNLLVEGEGSAKAQATPRGGLLGPSAGIPGCGLIGAA